MRVLWCARVATCVLAIAGVSLGEIPAGEDAATQRAWLDAWHAWAVRAHVDAYVEFGDHGGEPDETALEFLRLYVESEFGADRFSSAADVEALYKGVEAYKAGVRDPWVLTLLADVMPNAGNWGMDVSAPAMESWRAMGEGDRYTAWHRCRNAMVACRWFARLDRDEDERAAYARWADELVGAVVSGDVAEEDERFVWYSLASSLKDDLPEDIAADAAARIAAAEAPGGRVWLRDVLLGDYHIRRAWLERGTGWAHEVTDEGWAGFRRELMEADVRFRRAHAAAPDRPEAASGMITVSMGTDAGESPRAWFDRAVGAQMDWAWAYSRYRHALLPRWGGSHEAMIALGRECAATERYDTIVPLQLVRVIERIGWDEDRDYGFLRRDAALYEEARGVLERYVEGTEEAEYGDFPFREWTRLAVLGYLAGRYEDSLRVVRLLDRRGWKADFDIQYDWRVNYDDVRMDTLALAGPTGGIVRRGDEAFARRDWYDAKGLYEEAIMGLGGPGTDFEEGIRDRLDMVEFRIRAERGRRQIGDRTLLTGWRVARGNLTESNSTMLWFNAERFGIAAVHHCSLGSRYEVSMALDLMKYDTKGPEGGFLVGVDSEVLFPYMTVTLHRAEREIRINAGTSRVLASAPVELSERGYPSPRIDLWVWDDKVAAGLNGEPLVFARRPEWCPPRADERWGLCSTRWGRGRVRFSHIRVGVLKEEPEFMGELERAFETPKVEPDEDRPRVPEGG